MEQVMVGSFMYFLKIVTLVITSLTLHSKNSNTEWLHLWFYILKIVTLVITSLLHHTFPFELLMIICFLWLSKYSVIKVSGSLSVDRGTCTGPFPSTSRAWGHVSSDRQGTSPCPSDWTRPSQPATENVDRAQPLHSRRPIIRRSNRSRNLVVSFRSCSNWGKWWGGCGDCTGGRYLLSWSPREQSGRRCSPQRASLACWTGLWGLRINFNIARTEDSRPYSPPGLTVVMETGYGGWYGWTLEPTGNLLFCAIFNHVGSRAYKHRLN